jgi:hypothetical protein
VSNTQQHFEAAATVTVKTSPNDIWAIWADVNAWTSWDPGVARTEMRANFKSGSTFSLTPQGRPPIQVTIKTVTQGEEFSDEAVLPFGTIRTYHRMEPLGERVKMTHEVVADIDADSVTFFEKEIWPHLQIGLPVSVNNIANIVESD